MNKIFYGDNLDVLRAGIGSESVDLAFAKRDVPSWSLKKSPGARTRAPESKAS